MASAAPNPPCQHHHIAQRGVWGSRITASAGTRAFGIAAIAHFRQPAAGDQHGITGREPARPS
jgi:hypothetical protein